MKMSYGGSSGGHSKMSNVKSHSGGHPLCNVKSATGKQVTAGRGTIRTPFNKSVTRNVGRGR